MADRQPSRLGLRQHLRRFERYFRHWVYDYFADLLERSRMHDLRRFDVFETNAMDTVRNYAVEQGWDAYLPRTRAFMEQAYRVVRRQVESLRRHNRYRR